MIFFRMFLNFLGGKVMQGLVDAYRTKLEHASKTEQIAADLAAKEIEAEIALDAERAATVRAEQGAWYTAIIRPLFAAPFIIFAWKVVVWDKVFALGTTDPLNGQVGDWAGYVIIAYFGGRSLEKVSRMILMRR